MRRFFKYILWITILLFGAGLYSLNADFLAYTTSLPEFELLASDTIRKVKTRYPVAKTVPEEYQDILKESHADLKTPENVKTTIEYDIHTGKYVVRTKLGEFDLSTPILLTPEEYQEYSFQKSIQSYYRQKNEEEFQLVFTWFCCICEIIFLPVFRIYNTFSYTAVYSVKVTPRRSNVICFFLLYHT